MKTIARRLLTPLLAALFVAGAAAAETPTLANRLVGHWSLVSVAIGGQKPYGADPQGSMFFDVAGHYAVVVIGGRGSILGSILTGFALGVIEGLTKVFYPEASNTVVFVIMAIVLLIRPSGLFGRSA